MATVCGLSTGVGFTRDQTCDECIGKHIRITMQCPRCVRCFALNVRLVSSRISGLKKRTGSTDSNHPHSPHTTRHTAPATCRTWFSSTGSIGSSFNERFSKVRPSKNLVVPVMAAAAKWN